MTTTQSRSTAQPRTATSPRTAIDRASRQRRRFITMLLSGMAKHAVLIGLSVIFMIPLFWMVTGAFKTPDVLNAVPTVWFPDTITFDNFVQAFQVFPMLRFMINTFIICTLAMVGAVLSSAMVGYGLARIPWRGRNVLFVMILSTMMIPVFVTMFPTFEIFRALNLTNTWVPLILPSWFGVPVYIFLLRQFLMTIPKELSESARIDGAGEWAIFVRVILPLIKPALVAVGLFQFLLSWNDLLTPLIYLSDPKLYTLSLGLSYFKGQFATDFGPLMAAATITVLPIIVLFFFAQRMFIQGITLTGIKG